MVILDADHPDVLDFIESKAQRGEEGLGAHRAGLRPELHRRGLRQRLLPERQPQRPRDRRVHAAPSSATRDWTTHEVSDGQPAGTYKARDIFRKMAEAAWICGDPGHPVRHHHQRLAHVARTRTGSTRRNPCSEYMFLNDTACNLAIAEPDEVRAARTASSTSRRTGSPPR